MEKFFSIYNSDIFNVIDNNIKNSNINYINTRFAPDPNGFLHIGHVKSIFINYIIAKKYSGKFNIRFDDTNPSKNNKYYVNNIRNDIKWLGFNWDNEKYTSDYFNKIFYYAIKLIKKGLAYVDKLPINKFKYYKGSLKIKGVNSPYRDKSILENIKSFIKMKNGFYKENEACLRAKIDMKSNNVLMRDPVLYRIKYINHFRTGNTWCIYPTYDFSHCISDFLENITYSLCTLEFENNKELYNWILNSLEINNKPIQYEFSRLEIEYFLISKRKIKILIKNNIIQNWNDPRILTVSGMRNRGYTPESIKNFCKNIGITKKNSLIKIKYLENFLKKDLNKIAIRIMSVVNPVILYIDNFNNNEIELIKIPIDPKNLNLGFKKILFNKQLYVDKYDFYDLNKNYKKFIGNIIKLRHSYIIKIIKIETDINNNINIIYCKYYKNTLKNIFFKNVKIKKIIHWVSCIKNFKSTYKIYNNLFKTPFPNKYKDIMNIINKNSLNIKYGFTEKSSEKLKDNMHYQIERIGYFYAKKIDYKSSKIVFSKIIEINKNFL